MDDEVLPSEDAALVLRPLTIDDVDRYFTVVDRNRVHLTQHGDFGFLHDATLEDVRARFLETPGGGVRLGIWHSGQLIGRLDLDPIDAPRWVLGYWLDEGFTGQGHMTTACRAAIDLAHSLGVTELYAGVTDGNTPSLRLLQRLGFEHLQDVAGRSRWRLSLIADPPAPFMVSRSPIEN